MAAGIGYDEESIVDLIPLTTLAEELDARGEEAFLSTYPHPFLILAYSPPLPSEDVGITTEKTKSVDINKATKNPIRHTRDMEAVQVRKTKRNAYQSKITVGRAKNNDIVIRAKKISKIHGQFVPRQDGGFELVDMGSSNATIVNGTRLDEKVSIPIRSGDRIAFWRYVFEFVEPRPLIQILRETYSK